MKIRPQFFGELLAAYRLSEGDMAMRTSDGKLKLCTMEAAKGILKADNTSEYISISAHLNRWESLDLKDFIKNEDVPDLPELAGDIKNLLSKYIQFSSDQIAWTLALWIIGTYVYQIFNAYPYIHLLGPSGSGKSTILAMLNELVFNPIFTGNISVSAMFRVVEGSGGTILFDEAEVLDSEFGHDYRLLLNAGYKKGACVYRMERAKEGFELKEFDTYGPKAIASIGPIPSVLGNRCIKVLTIPTDKDLPLLEPGIPVFGKIRNKLYRFGLSYSEAIKTAYRMGLGVESLKGRKREILAPLKAIGAIIQRRIKNDNN